MSRVQPFDGFDLQQQTAIDQQIDTKGRVEARAFKMYIDRHLPIDPISTLDQLSSHDRIIDDFQQARTHFPVKAERKIEHTAPPDITTPHHPKPSPRQPLYIQSYLPS